MQSLTQHPITRSLNPANNLPKALIILVIISVISGLATGYFLAGKNSGSGGGLINPAADSSNAKSNITIPDQAVSTACPDFAQGTLKPIAKAADPSQYSEGTHLLERTGQTPVTLTSSAVDLTKYEGKNIKVFGATQKALKAGWLMDVCKVEQL